MRFSLATLLLTVIVIALVLVTVRQRMQLAVHLERQHKQANQIHELSAKLEELDGYGKIQRRTNDFIATLNLDDVEDLETFRLVQNVMPCAPSPEKTAIHESFQSRFQRLIDIDGNQAAVGAFPFHIPVG